MNTDIVVPVVYFTMAFLFAVGSGIYFGMKDDPATKRNCDVVEASTHSMLIGMLWPIPAAIGLFTLPFYVGKYIKKRSQQRKEFERLKRSPNWSG